MAALEQLTALSYPRRLAAEALKQAGAECYPLLLQQRSLPLHVCTCATPVPALCQACCLSDVDSDICCIRHMLKTWVMCLADKQLAACGAGSAVQSCQQRGSADRPARLSRPGERPGIWCQCIEHERDS